MSNHQNPEGSPRIALDDIIAAAGQGAMRALSARQQAANQGGGFYIDFYIRCGIPANILQTVIGGGAGPISGGGGPVNQ